MSGSRQMSLVENATNPVPLEEPISLADFAAGVRGEGATGGRWRRGVELVRAAQSEAARKAAKLLLMAVVVAGVFSYRDRGSLLKGSGYVVVDFDDVPDPADARDRIAQSPHVACAFISPSATGVKAIVAVEMDTRHADEIPEDEREGWLLGQQEAHGRAQLAAVAHLERLVGASACPGADLARLCFVSYDPSVHTNLETAPMPMSPAPPPRPPSPARPAPISHPLERCDRHARASAYLAKIPGAVSGQGGSRQTFNAALALVRGFDLSPDVALDLLLREYNLRCSPPWTDDELRYKVEAASKAKLPVGYLLDAVPSRANGAPSDRAVVDAPPEEGVGYEAGGGNQPAVEHAAAYEALTDAARERGLTASDTVAWARGLGLPYAAMPEAGKPKAFFDALSVDALERLVEALVALPADAPPPEPGEAPDAPGSNDPAAAPTPVPARDQPGDVHLHVVTLAEVVARAVLWLWVNYIALGKLTVFAGAPGIGKSTVGVDIAARVTRGGPWPAGTTSDLDGPGMVLLLSAEDDAGDTIKPRFVAAGGDPSKVLFLESVARVGPDGKRRRGALDFAADFDQLATLIKAHPALRLIVIDPLDAYVGNTDSHRNAAMRSQVLAPLAELAQKHDIAVVVVAHRRKAKEGTALDSVNGSIATVAAARAAWLFVADPEVDGRCKMLHAKGNLSPVRTGLAFRLEPTNVPTEAGAAHVAAVHWEADALDETADDAMAADRAAASPRNERGRRAEDEARERLEHILADGEWHLAREVEAEIKERANVPVSAATLKRAKAGLPIVSERRGEGRARPWWWRLNRGSPRSVAGSDAPLFDEGESAATPPGLEAHQPMRTRSDEPLLDDRHLDADGFEVVA